MAIRPTLFCGIVGIPVVIRHIDGEAALSLREDVPPPNEAKISESKRGLNKPSMESTFLNLLK